MKRFPTLSAVIPAQAGTHAKDRREAEGNRWRPFLRPSAKLEKRMSAGLRRDDGKKGRPIVFLFLPLLLTACEVGPNYLGPPHAAPNAERASGFTRAERNTDNAPPPAAWWQRFNDPELTRLVDLAFKASPNVEAAEARVREARANLAGATANLFPSANAGATYARIRLPTGGLSNIIGGAGAAGGGAATSTSLPAGKQINYYNVNFDATWELDLFGGTRRGIEAAGAQEEAARAQLADAQVQLAAQIGQSYVMLRGAQAKIALQKQSVAIERHLLDLTALRLQHGASSSIDTVRLQAQLENTEAGLPPLETQQDQALDSLAVLTGREPGALDRELLPPAPLPAPPTVTPVGDPGAMLRRRPDIRAAERQLAASTSEIGEALAQEYPQVSLFGTLGWGGTKPSQLFHSSSMLWAAAPRLQWNFLDFGRNEAQTAEARAARDEARAQYRQAVLAALQDAEDSLSRYGHQRGNVEELMAARDSAEKAASLTRVDYKAGTQSLIDLLNAEQSRVQAEQDLASAQAEFTDDYIALQKSLGLGWQGGT
jgi:NodT family efflux transporter outer membrane factor (OMF) lipoprotein